MIKCFTFDQIFDIFHLTENSLTFEHFNKIPVRYEIKKKGKTKMNKINRMCRTNNSIADERFIGFYSTFNFDLTNCFRSTKENWAEPKIQNRKKNRKVGVNRKFFFVVYIVNIYHQKILSHFHLKGIHRNRRGSFGKWIDTTNYGYQNKQT